jgi:hypothetical protein
MRLYVEEALIEKMLLAASLGATDKMEWFMAYLFVRNGGCGRSLK